MGKDHAHDLRQIIVGEIGRKLDQERRLARKLVTRLLHALKKRAERLGRLEIA